MAPGPAGSQADRRRRARGKLRIGRQMPQIADRDAEKSVAGPADALVGIRGLRGLSEVDQGLNRHPAIACQQNLDRGVRLHHRRGVGRRDHQHLVGGLPEAADEMIASAAQINDHRVGMQAELLQIDDQPLLGRRRSVGQFVGRPAPGKICTPSGPRCSTS